MPASADRSTRAAAPGSAHRAVEHAARQSYGRLVAWLAVHGRDLQRAEDAVGEALEAALRVWPTQGVPDNPEAWLLTTARRRVVDRARRQQTRVSAEDQLRLSAQEAAETPFRAAFPDRRLELLFLCAHPEIPAELRTPLMLQTVLGLDAERIAGAMLVKPATLAQRLVRAKRRIKEQGLSFEVPAPAEIDQRLGSVLEAIYGAFGTGWEALAETDGTGLVQEAIWLARLLVDLLPDAAEAKGLLALMLYCEARRAARRDEAGRFVPLPEQDPADWDHALILEAEKALWMAARLRQPGPFQIEAAIQSLHVHRARSGTTDWVGIHRMYEVLVRHYPSLGAQIGHAASLGHIGRVADGLAVLDGLEAEEVVRYQPYYAVRGWLLVRLARFDEAREALQRAAGLSGDEAVRAWLLEGARLRG